MNPPQKRRHSVKKFLWHMPKQRSCPGRLEPGRKSSRCVNDVCHGGFCKVHCPGGEQRRESFDYYAHPTSRGSLVQLTGLGQHHQETPFTWRLRKRSSIKNANYAQDCDVNHDDLAEATLIEANENEKHMEPISEEVLDLRSRDPDENKSVFISFMKALLLFWRSFLVVGVPLMCLPILFQGDHDTEKAFRCAFVMIIMAVFWVTEALPLAITSMIPVFLFPLFGIMTTDEVGKEYLKETNFMFISGIIVAIAVEHCNLHKRIALQVLMSVGTGPRRIMLGFMLPTMFLSMWISNTATTAMMVPIVNAVVTELEKEIDSQQTLPSNSNKIKEQNSSPNIRVMIFLSVAYAANTGGTGTLTGTGSNLVLKGVLSDLSENSPVNFATWTLFAAPIMLFNLILCWLWLQIWFMGFESFLEAFKEWQQSLRKRFTLRSTRPNKEISDDDPIKAILFSKYNELGPVTFHEGSVTILFLLLIFLWIFRDPKFIKGWGDYITVESISYQLRNSSCTTDCSYERVVVEKEALDDASAGILVVLLLFILPAKLNFWPFNRNDDSSETGPSPSLLDWSAVQSRMPWGIVFLLGGGFALAKATDVSGLSLWLGSQLKVLEYLDPRILLLLICLFTSFATEVTSNVATCSILLPVLRDLATSLHINPLFLMIPVTLTCSYAFMLPVATPPNAIVFSASGMKTLDMVKCGFFFNIICVITNFIGINTLGIYMFDLNTFPDWAGASV